VRGVDLELHPSPDYVSDHIRRTGDFYEVAILEELERRLQAEAPGVLVDVGAMIGNHATFLARFVPHTRLLAFEPSRMNRELLIRNLRPFRSSARVMPVALSDRVGYARMALALDNRGWSTVVATSPRLADGMVPFTARTYPLDHFRLADVRLLKIDVEHHEHQVLAGARETIARCHPLIVIEDWERDLAAVLWDLGYQLAVDWGDAHQTYLYEWRNR
jgi:FkbM family methyltransferase